MQHHPLSLKPLFLLTVFLASNAWSTHVSQKDPSVKFRVSGGYQVNPARTKRLWKGLTEDRFGTLTLTKDDGTPLLDALDDNSQIVIRDQHYPLYKFSENPISRWSEADLSVENKPASGFGIRVIPAVTGSYEVESKAPVETTGKNADGKTVDVKGSKLVDEYLRKVVYGYKGEDAESGPIFAQIAYMHPEGHHGAPAKLSGEPYLKTEMGFTHKGAYMGNGKSANSPVEYHSDSWWDDGQENYPALVSVFDFRGAASGAKFNVKAFNENAITTALILNESFGGPPFPDHNDYKFDPVYSASLETVLDYYARWLENDKTLQTDDLFKVYCAEHITDIINTHLNLPQNLASYKEVFGDTDGERLFELAMDALYRKNLRTDMGKIVRKAYLGTEEEFKQRKMGSSLTPYWKLLGHKGPVVKHDAANNRYVAIDPQFRIEGYSLGWTPETVADLARDFVREYLPWTRVGSVTSVAAILGFASEVENRMHIEMPEYLQKVIPIIQEIFLHEAAAERGYATLGKPASQIDEEALYKAFSDARDARQAALKQVLGAFKTDNADQKGADKLDAIIDAFTAQIDDPNGKFGSDKGWDKVSELSKQTLVSFKRVNQIDDKQPKQKLLAYREYVYTSIFSPKVAPILSKLNELNPHPSNKLSVKFYYAPAVHVRVALGTHDPGSRKNVRIYPVATVMKANTTIPNVAQTTEAIDDAIFTEFEIK